MIRVNKGCRARSENGGQTGRLGPRAPWGQKAQEVQSDPKGKLARRVRLERKASKARWVLQVQKELQVRRVQEGRREIWGQLDQKAPKVFQVNKECRG